MCYTLSRTWWILIFEMWFGWRLSRTKRNISPKLYLVKLSLTWRDVVLTCIAPWVQRKKPWQNWSLRYMLHVEYNVKGTSQNPGTWRKFLEICDARWWMKSTSWVHKNGLFAVQICVYFGWSLSWTKCDISPKPVFQVVHEPMRWQQHDEVWFLRYVLCEVCRTRRRQKRDECWFLTTFQIRRDLRWPIVWHTSVILLNLAVSLSVGSICICILQSYTSSAYSRAADCLRSSQQWSTVSFDLAQPWS